MPLELVDIDRLLKMESHPRCVSFGKKLTLVMRHDHRNNPIFPNHLREISVLLQTVTHFWRCFEHLEVRQLEDVTVTDVEHARRRVFRLENPDYFMVPFGDVGTDEKFHEWRTYFHRFVDPDDFEMYIPFLHLMTNLKKVTLLARDNWVSAHILLHIPHTANLKEIYMNSHRYMFRGFWSQSCAVMYQKCAKNVTFLAGVTPASISFRPNGLNAYIGIVPVFENLKEIHILVDHQWTDSLVDSMRASTVASMFPVVTTLVLIVNRTYIQRDLCKYLANFAKKFPCLNHFSLSGDCAPEWCTGFRSFSDANSNPITPSSETFGVLTTFQFQCPIHVPVELMQHFTSLEHVIIEEWPGKCQRHESKANDWTFLDCFFKSFPNVTSLSFVPVSTSEETHHVFASSRKVTRRRSEYNNHKDLLP